MSKLINRQFQLASRPAGEPEVANFKLVETAVADLTDGQVLLRNHYLSLDPYMRWRMNDAKSYAAPQALNEVMVGGTVGEVVASKSPLFKVGDTVRGGGGWQLYRMFEAAQHSTVGLPRCCRHAGCHGLVWLGQDHPSQGR